MFEIDDETDVWLEFDGEKLDPNATVGSSEVEDMDGLELHVVR